MAAPSYVRASTGTTDATGAWTHTSAAPSAAGRVLLVQVLQDGTAANVAIDSVTNAENLAGTDNVLTSIGEFDVGSAVAASQHLWIGRSLSTSAMVITGSNAGGDDVYVRVYEFRDVNTGATLADVLENGTAGSTANGAGTGTTISDTAVTTLGVDRLALQLVGANDDIAIDAFAGETGGDWVELVSEYADSGGTDGAVQIQGAYGYTIDNLPSIVTQSGFGSSGQPKVAQSFTAPSTGSSWRVAAAMGLSGSPTDDVVLSIQADSAGEPSGTDLGSVTINVDAGSSTSTVVYSDTITASLTSGNTYWLVFSRSGSLDANAYVSGRGSRSDLGTPLAYNGSTWIADGTTDRMFGLFAGTMSSGFTIDGGSDTVVSAAWGVVGFALIGTTPAGPATSDQTGLINQRRTPRRRTIQRM